MNSWPSGGCQKVGRFPLASVDLPPVGSGMLHGTGIFTYICQKFKPNVGKYSIDEAFGVGWVFFFHPKQIDIQNSRQGCRLPFHNQETRTFGDFGGSHLKCWRQHTSTSWKFYVQTKQARVPKKENKIRQKLTWPWDAIILCVIF